MFASFIIRGALVTSLAEVWIEINIVWKMNAEAWVTSLAEVWIEIMDRHREQKYLLSLPLRKCGLKYL